METKTKNSYETPMTTVTEVKAEGVICQSTLKTLWLGTESGSDPSSNYGLRDYTIQDSQNW